MMDNMQKMIVEDGGCLMVYKDRLMYDDWFWKFDG